MECAASLAILGWDAEEAGAVEEVRAGEAALLILDKGCDAIHERPPPPLLAGVDTGAAAVLLLLSFILLLIVVVAFKTVLGAEWEGCGHAFEVGGKGAWDGLEEVEVVDDAEMAAGAGTGLKGVQVIEEVGIMVEGAQASPLCFAFCPACLLAPPSATICFVVVAITLSLGWLVVVMAVVAIAGGATQFFFLFSPPSRPFLLGFPL